MTTGPSTQEGSTDLLSVERDEVPAVFCRLACRRVSEMRLFLSGLEVPYFDFK